jgi:hypothetical protein
MKLFFIWLNFNTIIMNFFCAYAYAQVLRLNLPKEMNHGEIGAIGGLNLESARGFIVNAGYAGLSWDRVYKMPIIVKILIMN